MKNKKTSQSLADIAILSCLKLGLPEIRVELIDLQHYKSQIVLVAHYVLSVCILLECVCIVCIYIDIPFYDLTITAHLGEQSYRRTLPIIQHSSSLFTKNDNFMFPASTTTNHGLYTKVAVKSLVQKEC